MAAPQRALKAFAFAKNEQLRKWTATHPRFFATNSKPPLNCIAKVHTLRYIFFYTNKEICNMSKTAHINLRIHPDVKANAQALFASFGLSVGDAIQIFLHQSLLVGGLPFEVKQPRYNKETEEAIVEAKQIMSGKVQTKVYDTAAAFFEDVSKDA